MKISSIIPHVALATLFCGSFVFAEGPYEPDWKSLGRHETPKWYANAVLGIYFHWGVYSVPAFGCWGGRNMYQPNGGRSEEWGHIEDKYANTYDYIKQVYGQPGTQFGYKDFIPMFKAEKWNPNEWAKLFKEAGADFAGPVAIHHDGFAMWDSEYAEYNSMDMGPRRDVVGQMLEAVSKHGMKTFASFHQYTNWFFFNPGRKICPEGVDVNNPKYAGLYGPVRKFKGMWQEEPFSESFQEAWYNKVIEVIDKYCPDQLWFEIGFSDPDCIGQDYVKSALAHYFNKADKLNKQVVVTRKSDDLPLSCSVLDIEAGELDEAQPDVWQTDISLGTNHSWAYSPDAVCRPINDIVDEIVDRKSKNGLTLLSVAPKADGTLPPSQIEGLKKLGRWMTINKPALYASKPAPFVAGGVDVAEAGSIRFTMKGNFVYAIDLAKPRAPYVIGGVKPVKDSKIIMLGSSEELAWHLDGEDVVIEKIPDPLPCDYAWTFKIEYKDEPLSAIGADEFTAEGLTEPVKKGRREFAVKVTFPNEDFYMEFSPPRACYYTPEGIGFSNEWGETASIETEHPGWGEVLFDRDAVMWIERKNPARKVVRFRGVLKTPEGEVLHTYVDSGSPYGEGDWSDEWYYIYPDGVSVRVIKIYTGKTEDAVAFWGLPGYCAFWGIRGTVFETQETFIHGIRGLQPPDIIETEALTLITMDGEYKRINYKPYPPDCSLFDPANIQMVNLKSKYHPFTIVTSGNVEIKPYYMPMDDHRNIDKTVFITWPRKGHFSPNEDYTSALAHVIKWGWHEKTDKTLTQIYLLGMTDEPTEQQRIDKLVSLARSWEKAPDLILKSEGYSYDGYEIKEKAYILTNISSDRKDIHFSLKASPEKPLFNPVFVIKQMNANKSFKLMINDKKFNNYRVGFEDDNMVIWIPVTAMKDTTIKLLF